MPKNPEICEGSAAHVREAACGSKAIADVLFLACVMYAVAGRTTVLLPPRLSGVMGQIQSSSPFIIL